MTYNVWVAVTPADKAQADDQLDATKVKTGLEKVQLDEAQAFAKSIEKASATYYRKPEVGGKTYQLESIYTETLDDIALLEKSGSVILGVWDWSGAIVDGYSISPDLDKYMPPRYETINDVVTEVADNTLRDVHMVWGQGPRQFA